MIYSLSKRLKKIENSITEESSGMVKIVYNDKSEELIYYLDAFCKICDEEIADKIIDIQPTEKSQPVNLLRALLNLDAIEYDE